MKKIILLILLAFSPYTLAGKLYCKGLVTNLYVDATDTVIVRGAWRNDYTKVCNTAGDDNVNPQTCSIWTSILMKSLTDNKEVIISYDDANGTRTCSNLATYHGSPAALYVMLVK